MLKLKSDKSLLEFFTSGGRALKVGGLLLLGVLLIFIGGVGGEKQAVEVSTAEERVAEMCSLIEGVGECQVMMTYYPDDESRVYAVLVLCDGAESVYVREKITSTLCTLYGIGAHRVKIGQLANNNLN